MSLQKLADEFLIYQYRLSGTHHKVPICGLCNNSGSIRLFANCEGRAEERPCICRNGRALKRGLDRKERGQRKTKVEEMTKDWAAHFGMDKTNPPAPKFDPVPPTEPLFRPLKED